MENQASSDLTKCAVILSFDSLFPRNSLAQSRWPLPARKYVQPGAVPRSGKSATGNRERLNSGGNSNGGFHPASANAATGIFQQVALSYPIGMNWGCLMGQTCHRTQPHHEEGSQGLYTTNFEATGSRIPVGTGDLVVHREPLYHP